MDYYSLPQNLMAVVLDINRALCSKSDEFSFVLARMMAYDKSIAQAQSPAEAASILTGTSFDAKVSAVNKFITIDIQKVREYTKRFTAWRFEQMTGQAGAPYGREGSECEDFFGLSKHFDAETLKKVKECAQAMVRYHVKLSAILEHINETQKQADIAEVN